MKINKEELEKILGVKIEKIFKSEENNKITLDVYITKDNPIDEIEVKINFSKAILQYDTCL